jgi:hypothetical protein
MIRTDRWHTRSTIAGIALAAATTLAFAPAGTAATTPTTPEQMINAVGVGDVAIDYEIVLDTSHSMLRDGRYATVTKALKRFLTGLRPIDHVSIIGFDVTAQRIYEGDPQGAADLRLPTPGALGTDLGAGLQQAISDLERTDAAPAAGVVLLTDGIINAPGSRYAALGSRAWVDLAKRVEELPHDHHVKGFALPLTTSVGAQGLAEVFPDTVVWQEDPSRLFQSLARVTQQLRATTAADRLTADAARGLTVRWPAGNRPRRLADGRAEVEVTLTSNTQILPLRVRVLAVTPEGFPATVTGLPRSVDLAPGQTVTVKGRLTIPTGSHFSVGRRETGFAGRLSFRGGADSPWRPLATQLGANVTVPALVSTQEVSGTTLSGLSWWIFAALGAVALLLLLAAVRARLRGPRLTGTIEVDSVDEEHTIELGRRRRLVLAGDDLLGLPGRCELRGTRQWQDERAGEREDARDGTPSLQIRYSGGAVRDITRTVHPGDRTEIGGVGLRYRPAPGQRSPDRRTSAAVWPLPPSASFPEPRPIAEEPAPRSIELRDADSYSRLED